MGMIFSIDLAPDKWASMFYDSLVAVTRPAAPRFAAREKPRQYHC